MSASAKNGTAKKNGTRSPPSKKVVPKTVMVTVSAFPADEVRTTALVTLASQALSAGKKVHGARCEIAGRRTPVEVLWVPNDRRFYFAKDATRVTWWECDQEVSYQLILGVISRIAEKYVQNEAVTRKGLAFYFGPDQEPTGPSLREAAEIQRKRELAELVSAAVAKTVGQISVSVPVTIPQPSIEVSVPPAPAPTIHVHVPPPEERESRGWIVQRNAKGETIGFVPRDTPPQPEAPPPSSVSYQN
jgi:hypothetical protein